MSNAPFPSPEMEDQQQALLTSPGGRLQGDADEQDEAGEVERLLLLHRRLSESMGGILPAGLDLAKVKRVLDVECGAGGWMYDLAWRHPSMYVTGTDSRPHLVKAARALADRVGNATALEQDIHALSAQVVPLDSFDMVHARFLVGRLAPQEYPSILASLVSRCRSGGLLVWEESEYPITNSPVCEQLYRLVQDALQAAGRAFSPGHALGITAMMSGWLKETGCRIVLDNAYAIDVSAGMNGYYAFLQQMWIVCRRLRPFLLQMGITTESDFEVLCTQARQEMAGPGFRGLVYVRTLAGVVELHR